MAVTVYVYEQFVLDPQGNVRPKLLMNRRSEP